MVDITKSDLLKTVITAKAELSTAVNDTTAELKGEVFSGSSGVRNRKSIDLTED